MIVTRAMENVVRSRVAVIAALFLALSAAAHSNASYTFVWIPRTQDVGAPDSKDYVVLAALLRLVPTESYSVGNGDTFDYIVRKQFLLSSSLPHAYTLYLARIRELNPGLKADALRVNSSVRIPIGPRYGATELAKEAVPQDLRKSVFTQMSVKAYGLGQSSQDQILVSANRHLAAFVSPFKKATADFISNAIVARGLVTAISIVKHPESRITQMQALDFTVATPEGAALAAAIELAAPGDVVPGFLPVDTSFPANCSGCRRCSDILSLPTGIDLSKSRVLVEDTGIAPGIVDPSHVLQQFSGGDGADTSPDSHGTFVYSEIAAPDSTATGTIERGIVPKASVFVTRVVQQTPAGQLFSMSDMLKGWQTLDAYRIAHPGGATTWVINISAASGPDPTGATPPTILESQNLLIVAAAGNHNSSTEPALYAFGRFSSGGIPLLIVGAQDVDGNRATYSNYNSTNVHLFAPGNCVCGSPGQLNGTSQATPIVTAAAAVIASQRPDWNALYVMWRLISTADQSPGLQNGVFAGTVNLAQALERRIVVKQRSNAAEVLHRASSATFDPVWAASIHSAGMDMPGLELLRLYGPRQMGGQTCFTAVQLIQLQHGTLCVPSESAFTIMEYGSPMQLHASEVSDIVLPMPSDRDSAVVWPAIGVSDST